jgi:taurine dioxygenase
MKAQPGPLLAQALLTPQFASEVTGLDLARSIGPSAAAALLDALNTRGVLVLRGQRMTPQQFANASRSLGELAENPLRNYTPPALPELLICSNIIENGTAIGYDDAGRRWRMEGAQLKIPTRATLQYAAEIPLQNNCDTLFASTRLAYDALDPLLRQQLHGARAVALNDTNRRRRAMPYYADAGLSQLFQRGVEHPVVRTHPHTRQKCLYVSEGGTARISGMNHHDSDALLKELYRHMERPAFIYRHAWRTGDLVLWDNGSVQYRTIADCEAPQRRLLYRAQLQGLPARRTVTT